MTFMNTAIILFLIIDIFGAIPLIFKLISPFDQTKQKKIAVRELLLSLGIMLTFYFFGATILSGLSLSLGSMEITGGILLFLISIKMLFQPGDV